MRDTDAAGAHASVNAEAYRVLAWLGVVVQATAFIAVLWLQRWNGAWSIAVFFALSLAFLLMKESLASLMSLLVVVAAMVNAGGWAWNWFNQFVWYDEGVHLFTAFSVTAALGHMGWTWGALRGSPLSAVFVLKLSLIGVGLGVLWEVLEAVIVNLSWIDTIVDLVMDALGAAAAGLFAGWVISRQSVLQPSRKAPADPP